MAGRRNQIDSHPEKEQIITAMLQNKPSTQIEALYGVSRHAVSRYRKNLGEAALSQLRENVEPGPASEEVDLHNMGRKILLNLQKQQKDLEDIKQRADREKIGVGGYISIAAIREIRSSYDTLLRIIELVREFERPPEEDKDSFIRVLEQAHAQRRKANKE